jgi:hypothetical protein
VAAVVYGRRSVRGCSQPVPLSSMCLQACTLWYFRAAMKRPNRERPEEAGCYTCLASHRRRRRLMVVPRRMLEVEPEQPYSASFMPIGVSTCVEWMLLTWVIGVSPSDGDHFNARAMLTSITSG